MVDPFTNEFDDASPGRLRQVAQLFLSLARGAILQSN